MSEAVKVAAEMAEREGRYRDAYGKWCELITESERYGICLLYTSDAADD